MENSCETKASCMQMALNKIKYRIPELIGVVLGAVGGYIYYITIGCSTGTCPITSNPLLTILWGSVFGYLIGNNFNKKQKKQ